MRRWPDGSELDGPPRAVVRRRDPRPVSRAVARGGMVVPRQAALDDPKAWLREEMARWKRDVEDVGIVVEE